MSNAVISQLKEVIIESSKIKLPLESITEKTNLIEDLGYESVSLIQLVVGIESRFNINFANEDLDVELIADFKKLSDYVSQLVSCERDKD